MLIAEKYEIPDMCPKDCKFINKPFSQGSTCTRCPIFNCRSKFRLIEPEDFREDWAKDWYEFFKTGKSPELKLQQNENGGVQNDQ